MKPKGKDREKANKNTFKEVPCIIGIDQSYTRTGISICVNDKLKKISSIDYKGLVGKTEKRILLAKTVKKAIESCLKKFDSNQITIIVERIRTFTSSHDIRPEFIKSQGALIATIVDTAFMYGIKVYSVDTRAWKSAVLGTSKPVFEPIEGVSDPQKFGSVRKIIDLGFEEDITVRRGKNSKISLNDDAADSACIALYGFTGYPYLLILET